jgi:hypothetical protein
MSDVRIERFATCDDKEDRAKNDESVPAIS